MSHVTIKSQGTVYGSKLDPLFHTSDYHRAEAHAFIHTQGVEDWIRARVIKSARFTEEGNVEGEVRRLMDFALDFNTECRHGTAADHFGMDKPEPE